MRARNEKTVLKPSLATDTIAVGAGEHVTYVGFAARGATATPADLTFNLDGDGARATVLVFDLGSSGTATTRVVTHHVGERTEGTVWVKSVLGGNAHGTVAGNIRIAKSGRLANGYFTHHALMLSDRAVNDSAPMLEIENNEVKASHSATTGTLDADTLFYLSARGIEPETARRLVLTSFACEPLSAISDEQTREQVRLLIERHLDALS